jgi:hypothetical protein
MKTVLSFETSEYYCLVTHRHIAEERNPPWDFVFRDLTRYLRVDCIRLRVRTLCIVPYIGCFYMTDTRKVSNYKYVSVVMGVVYTYCWNSHLQHNLTTTTLPLKSGSTGCALNRPHLEMFCCKVLQYTFVAQGVNICGAVCICTVLFC